MSLLKIICMNRHYTTDEVPMEIIRAEGANRYCCPLCSASCKVDMSTVHNREEKLAGFFCEGRYSIVGENLDPVALLMAFERAEMKKDLQNLNIPRTKGNWEP